MKKKIDLLLKYVFASQATDVHFVLNNNKLNISVRGVRGIEQLKDSKLDQSLFHYLKYMSNLDLGNTKLPQSGNFNYNYKNKQLFFRFAYLQTLQLQSGVLRVLNNHKKIEIDDLSLDKKQVKSFINWSKFRSGLVLISGPTGSGKSTTLHAILEKISANQRLKVITLEDPIEIQSDNYLQLQINDRMNFNYEEGIRQLLRHDPDVIMIGEVRDEITARMLIRSALSGHMVFTTIHAKSCKEAIKRLKDFGIKDIDLKETLTGITNQRIFSRKGKKERVCIYEILEGEELNNVLQTETASEQHKDISNCILEAVEKGWITKKEAQTDIEI